MRRGLETMKFISLFSGIGGFDLGFERAGMECVTQVEFDTKARGVLATHWSTVKQLEDVRHVGKRNLTAVDLICGGFPCQDVSVAGRRAGLAGERSGLWFEFLRIITELTPRWVIIENVPGLLHSNTGRDFATVISGLVKCGYRVGWRVLDSQYFGLAQRRKRVFIVAGLGSAGCNPAEVLFERESSSGRNHAGEPQGETPTPYVIKGAAIGRRPENGPQYGEISEDGTCYTLNTSEVHAVAAPLTFRWNYNGHETDKSHTLLTDEKGSGSRVYAAIETYRKLSHSEYRAGDVASAIKARDGRDATDLVAFDYRGGDDSKWQTRNSGHKGGGAKQIVRAGEYAGAINATKQDAVAIRFSDTSEYAVRRLTPTECERLQGFPDGWTAVNEQSDSARYKQLGNAVSVPVAEWIGKRLMQANANNQTDS